MRDKRLHFEHEDTQEFHTSMNNEVSPTHMV